MQAIENLTRLRGRVLKKVPDPRRAGYELLTVQVDDAHSVEGKADLLSRHLGGSLEIAVRSELLKDAKAPVGQMIALRAKMTPDGALAEINPEPGDFAVTPGPNFS